MVGIFRVLPMVRVLVSKLFRDFIADMVVLYLVAIP